MVSPSASSNVVVIEVNYGGVFQKNPLMYSLGLVKNIGEVDFQKMEFKDLIEFVEKITMSKCEGLYYCVPGKSLDDGFRVIKCELDIYRFLDHAVSNGGRISLYIDHYDEDLTDFIREDNLIDLIVDVDTAATGDIGNESSDDSYQLSNDDDSTSDSTSLDHEHDDDDDDDDDNDVTTMNQTSNDHFLSLLCYDNVSSDDVDNELSSDENWSANEEGDDSDGSEKFIERGVEYPCYDPTINWKKMKSMVGMKFESVKQLKESLIDYGVSNGYPLEYPVNDYRRLLVRCGREETDNEDVGKTTSNNKKKRARDCPFRLWASMITDDGSFQIKSINEKHICSRKFSLGSLVTYNWIAKRYFKELIQNPDMSIRAMQMDILRKFKCKVSNGQCSRAKKKALDEYEGGLKEHYSRLCDYGAEILRTNPGSTVKMSISTMSDGSIYFNSLYICFKGIKDGWINGCRKVIGLDGCFLKSVCEGQLLSAIGRDANNHIFPLAWAVVSVENNENWKWFLELLRNDIGMVDEVGLTLISDQHKGILEAVKDVFPHGEHRQCTRHIYANFKKTFRGIHFKNLFWAAANSTTVQHFEEKMNEMKDISNQAYTHLIDRNPKSWSRAFFEVDRACDAFENGMSESFNSRIRKARRKPIITMLEEIRTYVMKRTFRMATKAKNLKHDVCLTIRKRLEEIKVKQRHWNVIPSNCNQFEVMNEYDAYVVDISACTCSCRSWQLSGIPCVHTVAALAFLNKDAETYVSDWLKKDMFKQACNYPIRPMKGSSFWPKIDYIKPLPPKERRMPGRPSVKRKRDASEKESKYLKVGTGRKMTCKICKQKGHNRRSCKNQPKDAQPKEVRPKGRPKRVNPPTNLQTSTSVGMLVLFSGSCITFSTPIYGLFFLSQSTTILIPTSPRDVLPHFARDEVDVGDQMADGAGQESQTIDEV